MRTRGWRRWKLRGRDSRGTRIGGCGRGCVGRLLSRCVLSFFFALFSNERANQSLSPQNTVDPYERALYGALSGDVASVLPVCSTWEDVVWAHLNSLFESHIEAGLAVSPSGRYWQQGSVAALPSKPDLDPEDDLLGKAISKPVRQELEQVFERLVRSDKAVLAAAAKNPFHLSQAYLIVGKLGELIETFVERLEAAAADTEPECVLSPRFLFPPH
jgi:nuclear pore complex protein Nup107